MPFYSPLRYPGGKRRLSSFLIQLLEHNELQHVNYVEPFAGGASLALALLLGEHASVIHINDLSRPIYAFWHSVLNDSDELCHRIQAVDITMTEWHHQRSIYDRRDEAELIDLGFATFFLNRTNRSGIIGGGVIGGKEQTGKWSLDARFTKKALIERIRRIKRYSGRIRIYNEDGGEFTKNMGKELGDNALFFIDPPYIDKGQDLYLNNYDARDHQRLECQVKQLHQPWVVTYDYDGAIRHELYQDYPRLAFELSYSAQTRQKGKEALFISDRLSLADEWHNTERLSMSDVRSSHKVFGTLEGAVRSRQGPTDSDVALAPGPQLSPNGVLNGRRLAVRDTMNDANAAATRR